MNSIVAVSSKLQIDLLSFQGLQSFTPLEDSFNLLVDRIGPSGLGVRKEFELFERHVNTYISSICSFKDICRLNKLKTLGQHPILSVLRFFIYLEPKCLRNYKLIY